MPPEPASRPTGLPVSPLTSTGRLEDPIRVTRIDASTDIDRAALLASDVAAHPDHIAVGLLSEGPLEPHLHALVATLDVTYVGPGCVDPPATVVVSDDPDAACAATRASIRANPVAAQILRTELRTISDLPVRAALDVESFAYSTLLGGAEFARWLAARGPRPLPLPATDPVLLDRVDDVLTVVLNRPERRNAHGAQLRDALCEALDLALADESITAVVLRGAGPSFCAGGDLDEFGSAPDAAVAHTLRTIAGAGRRLAALSPRVTALVHGACIGAGIELPAFATTVIAHPTSRFRLPEVSMGVIPGAGGTVSISRRIGRWRTFHLAVSGAEVDAPTALSWGLVDRIEDVPPATR